MKEATGELSMTVVTIVAIVAVLAIVTYFLAPKAKEFIEEKWGEMTQQTDTGSNMYRETP